MAILKIFHVFFAFFFPFFLFSFFLFPFSFSFPKKGKRWARIGDRGKWESSTRVGKYTRVGYEIFLLDVILLYS